MKGVKLKVIVQAGGLGTRMQGLTSSKPKGLISVFNKPIIFHLFDLLKKKLIATDFIIIGDYKFDVLDKYLTVFAKDTNYILLKAYGKGNAAGLKDALKLVPENEEVLIIWSDLILPEDIVFEHKTGCQVGIVNFPCSWMVKDGKLSHEKTEKNGLAGLYLFSDKKLLESIPEAGSFTDWLAKQTFPISTIDLTGCKDVGTLQAFQLLDNSKYRCRPYNKISIFEDSVVKEGLTPEAKLFVKREIEWYKKLQSFGFKNIPKLLSEEPMKMSKINGQNLFLSVLAPDGKREVFKKLVKALKRLHSFEEREASSWDIYREYFQKTIERLRGVAHSIPFANEKKITINGLECINILQCQNTFREAVMQTLMSTVYTPIHGDCQLTNTLLDSNGDIFFIDPRGYFGSSQIFGDVRYDWAKVYFAIIGNFDQYNIKNISLSIENDGNVKFKIGSGGWEFLEDYFLSEIPNGQGSRKEIELIHSVIWLSMASHAWEDFDSMCIAFYKGTLLFNKWLKDYSENADN